MQKRKDAEKLQEQIFGKRYVGADLFGIKSLSGDDGKRISEWIAKPEGFIVMHGPSGTGKTHLAAAVLSYVPDKYHFIRGYNERDFLKKVRQSIDSFAGYDYTDYIQNLLDDHIIFFDDFGCTGHTDWREEVLLSAVDYLYCHHVPAIISTNLNRKEMYQAYGERLPSRLFAKQNIIVDFSECEDLREQGL